MPPTEAAPPRKTLEDLDPDEIIPKNVRQEPDAGMVDSIRRRGQLAPVGVLKAPDGRLFLRFGDRRRLACIALGRTVEAVVVEATEETLADEINKIFDQLAENDDREPLTAADRAYAVDGLFELGADEQTIERETGYSRAEITAARKAAKSKTARTLAAQYPLTMPQLAVIMEFDDAPEVAEELARAAKDNPGQFDHLAEEAREDRAEAAMITARTAELTGQGVRVAGEHMPYEKRIEYWNGADGRQLTPETHKDCPGAVVLLRISGYDDNRKVDETGYCTDPKANGHKKRSGLGQPEVSPEEATAEHKRVIEGNKSWRAATAVRRRWLRDVLLARKDPPAGADQFIARAIAAADRHLINAMTTMSGGKHPVARELLGVTGKDTWNSVTREYDSPLTDSLSGISDQRAQMATLALIIGSYEGQAADPQTWRSPSRPPREYLSALAGWGYGVSEIEQGVVDAAGTASTPALAAAAAGED